MIPKSHHATAITDADDHDIEAIARIYAYYVEHTLVTLEEISPTMQQMCERWRLSADKGLAYAAPYRHRTGYRYTLEASVYLDKAHVGKGIGHVLLTELIDRVQSARYKTLLAIICGEENAASIKLHEAHGFTRAGCLKSVGFKHGQWIDTLLMQKMLA